MAPNVMTITYRTAVMDTSAETVWEEKVASVQEALRKARAPREVISMAAEVDVRFSVQFQSRDNVRVNLSLPDPIIPVAWPRAMTAALVPANITGLMDITAGCANYAMQYISLHDEKLAADFVTLYHVVAALRAGVSMYANEVPARESTESRRVFLAFDEKIVVLGMSPKATEMSTIRHYHHAVKNRPAWVTSDTVTEIAKQGPLWVMLGAMSVSGSLPAATASATARVAAQALAKVLGIDTAAIIASDWFVSALLQEVAAAFTVELGIRMMSDVIAQECMARCIMSTSREVDASVAATRVAVSKQSSSPKRVVRATVERVPADVGLEILDEATDASPTPTDARNLATYSTLLGMMTPEVLATTIEPEIEPSIASVLSSPAGLRTGLHATMGNSYAAHNFNQLRLSPRMPARDMTRTPPPFEND